MQFRSSDGVNVSEWSKVYNFTTIGDATPPANPANLDWVPTGESFIATWNAPTLDGNGKPLKDLFGYEVTVEANGVSKVYTTNATTWEFTLVMNAQAFGGIELTVKVTVKAIDNSGNKSSGVNKTATEDTPPVPSTPVVTNSMGQIALEWDGSTTVGVINPFNLEYVEIHASTTNNFTPSTATVVGRFEGWVSGKQRTIVPGLTYGTLHYFKLISVNKKGKKSVASGQAQGTPSRITNLDIQNGSITVDQINFTDQLGGGRAWYQDDPPTTGAKDGDTWFDKNDKFRPYIRVAGVWTDVRDASIADVATSVTAVQNTANAKNQVTYSTAAPVLPGNPGTRVGDIWFVRNTGTGIITAQYEWTGSAWTAKTLDNSVIANLDAGKITAGTLDANRIAAKTITANKLTIGDMDNLQNNGDFEAGSAEWSGNLTIDTARKRTGTQSMRMDSNGTVRDVLGTVIKCNGESQQFYAEAWVQSNNITATGTLQLAATAVSQTGVQSFPTFSTFAASTLSTTLWTKVSGTITVPVGTASFQVRPTIRNDVATGFSLWWDDIAVRSVSPAVLIADGAVTAAKINAGAVTANSVGTNLIITSAANIGTAVIDDAKIANVKAGKIVADDLATNTIISNTAQIKDAIITSAKIISITADKILTGSLQANQKIIAGPVNSDHAEMTSTGFRVFTNDPIDGIPNEVIRMGTDTNDFFGVVNSTGNLVASVDDTGSASFNRVVANSMLLNGAELGTLISDVPQGEVGRFRGQLSSDLGRIYVDYGVAEVGAALVKGRAYRVDYRVTYKTEVGGDEVLVSLRHTQGTDGNVTTQAPAPNVNNPRFQVHRSTGERTNYWYTVTGSAQFYPTATTRHRIHMDIGRGPAGASPSNLGAFYVTTDPIELMITDLGPAGPVSGGFTSAGGQLVAAPAATPAAASTSQQYYVDLAPAGWASLRGDGSTRTDVTGPVQGWDPGGTNGDGRGHWYFNLPSITGTIDRMDFYCYSNHWYYNSGGTAIFNVAVGSTPYAKPRGDWFVGGYPKPGGKEVQLPVDWYPMFTNAGAYGYPRANGITVGWSGNTNLAYYGRFDGNSARLRIYYTQ